MIKYIFVIALTLSSSIAIGQSKGMIIPKHNDEYSAFVEKLEKGQLDIDYAAFRNSFLKSKQYKVNQNSGRYIELKGALNDVLETSDHQKLIKHTQEMLSLNYTSIFGHKFLSYGYKMIGDSANSQKYDKIKLGLIRSIINSGDGQTCETGWHVIEVEEEYVILKILGAQLLEQALVPSEKGHCDKMHVKEKGVEKDYFFEINSFFGKLD